jgi:molybdopterin-guanine dinucleotide biosynthesis adapter protein
MRVIGSAGWSGAGKTSLIVRLIPALRVRGLRISTLKHVHHDLDVDQPGKDSFLHRQAGANEVLVASRQRFALIRELRGGPEPSLADHLLRLAEVDFVLVEGFRQAPHAKIEVHRANIGKPFLFPQDPSIKALVSDARPSILALFAEIPHADFADIDKIVGLVERFALPLDQTLHRLAAPVSG